MLTYKNQYLEHLLFLRSNGFHTQKLKLNKGPVTYRKGTLGYQSHETGGGAGIETRIWRKDQPAETFKTGGMKPTPEELDFFATESTSDIARALRAYVKAKS